LAILDRPDVWVTKKPPNQSRILNSKMGLRNRNAHDSTDELSAVSSAEPTTTTNGGGGGGHDPEDIWAISEGYTPLQDPSLLTQLQAQQIATASFHHSNDDDEEEDDEDEDVGGGEIASSGRLVSLSTVTIHPHPHASRTFRTSDATVFFQTNNEHDDDVDDDDAIVAENALRLLDADYQDTIVRTRRMPVVADESLSLSLSLPHQEQQQHDDDDHDHNKQRPRQGEDQLQHHHHRDDEDVAAAAAAPDEELPSPAALFHADFTAMAGDSGGGGATTTGVAIATTASRLPVDTAAVLRAVESIRRNDPAFAAKFEAWDRQEQH
jgi:hypothetical protein